VTDLGRY